MAQVVNAVQGCVGYAAIYAVDTGTFSGADCRLTIATGLAVFALWPGGTCGPGKPRRPLHDSDV